MSDYNKRCSTDDCTHIAYSDSGLCPPCEIASIDPRHALRPLLDAFTHDDAHPVILSPTKTKTREG